MTTDQIREALRLSPILEAADGRAVSRDIAEYWLDWAEAHNAEPSSPLAFAAWCLRMEEAVSNCVLDMMPSDWWADGSDSEGGAA